MTAHDVVNRVRRLSGIKQVGHGGTLDPAAFGVLPLAVGKACRLLRFLPANKVYVAEILLGMATDTDDLEGQVISSKEDLPPASEIRQAIGSFVGQINQIPPAYSAVHHQGQRLHALARAGKPLPVISPRKVFVDSIEVLDVTLPVVRARIACSSGTYIRAIARDLGQLLGCGGCLKSLRREQSGPFKIDTAINLEQLKSLADLGQFCQALVSPVEVLGLERAEVEEAQVDSLLKGQSIVCESVKSNAGDNCRDYILATRNGQLIAVCRRSLQGALEPEVVVGNRK